MTGNKKFVIKTKNVILLNLLYKEINKLLNKKFKEEMIDGKAMLFIGDGRIELVSLDPGLSGKFEKSFKKNMKGMSKLLQKGLLSKMYGDFKMEMVSC